MTQKLRTKMAWIYWGSLIFLSLLGFLYWCLAWRHKAYTNDAYVGGNQVYITPLHDGFVTSIHTDDTYLVKKGDLLVALDRTDSLIALDRANAQLAETVRHVCQLFHQVFVYQAKIDESRAKFIEAAQSFQHRWNVLPANAVSLEEYEQAVAALRMAYFSLQTNETRYHEALSVVQQTTIEDHPLVRKALDQAKEAWLRLYRCNIYSPVEGLAAQRSIQVGMWTQSGTPLMSVIPLDQIWVHANFKETQLRHMKIGQRVKITSDLYGRSVVFKGKIAGLPGVAGNAVSLLPSQNLSGNWIKIVQRLPVRVELDPAQLKEHPLRIGLSLEATVDLNDEGSLLPDSSNKAPVYETSIFTKEEDYDKEWIDRMIVENIDPTLMSYRKTPLTLSVSKLQIPAVIQSVLLANPQLPFEPPLPISMQQTALKDSGD